MKKIKKQIDDSTIKDIRNLFRLRKENEVIKDRVIRDIRNLFEYEKEDYTLVRIGNFWSTNHLDHYQLKNNLIKLDHT